MDREARYPLGSQVRLADLAVDPYPIFHRLRDREPVSWMPEIESWLVTRFDDVKGVLGDAETFTTESSRSPILATFGRQMLSDDGPERRRAKTFATESFTVPALRRNMESQLQALVGARLDAIAPRGEADLMSELASPVALASVSVVLGLPLADLERLRGWYEAFAAALANLAGEEPTAAAGRRAAAEFRDYLRRRLEEARGAGGRTLLARFADADRAEWPTDAVFSNLMIVLFGGIETTESMIGNAIWALLGHAPNRVGDDAEALAPAVEESLRWEPAVQSCTRWATRDVEIRGVPIRAGEMVQCMLGAANRDPAHFPLPDVFDPRRSNAADHLAFGAGRHFCLGAHLARMETLASLRGLFDRLPGLELDPARPSGPRGHEFRKPPRLWVRFPPALTLS